MTSHAQHEESETRGLALVLLTYRCAMAEVRGTDARYRAGAWEILEAAAPGGEAEALFGCFFSFVRSLVAGAERTLEWRQTYCAHLCRDEWLAVGMIDAAQRADAGALRAFASELLGADGLGDALNSASALAAALAQRGVYLAPRRVLH